MNPKFIRPCGIQRFSISIKAIQTRIDNKIQLKTVLKNKFELEVYKEGELFTQIAKSTPVKSSINGYLKDIFFLQVLHLKPSIKEDSNGILSYQIIFFLHFGQ